MALQKSAKTVGKVGHLAIARVYFCTTPILTAARSMFCVYICNIALQGHGNEIRSVVNEWKRNWRYFRVWKMNTICCLFVVVVAFLLLSPRTTNLMCLRSDLNTVSCMFLILFFLSYHYILRPLFPSISYQW